MENLLERVQKGDILVADGAMGTMLIERGLRPGEAPESLNVTRPEVVGEVSRLYFEAGAQMVETNTFGGSPLKLSFYALEDRTEEINRNAVLAARNAVGDRAYILASCGPSGKLLKPYGDTEPDDLYRSFERQMRALINAGVDMVCVETMTDLTEATLAVKAAKDVSTAVPVAATMTFEATRRGFYTVMGVSVAHAAEGLESAGADIIGSNCGNGIENMIKIARELKEYTRSPLMIQSNAGIPQFLGNRPVYPETPEFMAEKAKELVSIGVSIIGGCCGTTPAHIREIRQAVDSMSQRGHE